jgi:hypothetical protein
MPPPDAFLRPDDVSSDRWERRTRQKSRDGEAKAREAIDGCPSDWYRAAARPRRPTPRIVELLTEEDELRAINAELERQYRGRSDGTFAIGLDAEIDRLERRAALIIRMKATTDLARLGESLDAATTVARALLQRNK